MTYFALRSYQDDGEHYEGQIGSEPTPADFLAALWAVTDELYRVLKPTGSLWVNLGDKYAGSGGHNNANISRWSTAPLARPGERLGRRDSDENASREWRATLRTAPDRYNQSTDVPAKSLMGLPWRYALGLICPDVYRPDDGPQWTLRAEVVWSKPNGLPESVTDRVRRSHEQWFHLTKQGRYYAAVDEIRDASQRVFTARQDGTEHHAVAMDGNEGHHRYDVRANNPLGKLPGSVWTIPSEPLKVPEHLGVDHFAAFPQELVRRIILGWSPSGICTKCREGRVPVVEKAAVKSPVHSDGSIMGNRNGGPDERGWDGLPRFNREHTITGYACACDVTLAPTRPAVILDPFVGTGTVPMVARALGRYGVGIDLSRDYLRLASWRINESRHGAKSVNRTNRERQGQLW